MRYSKSLFSKEKSLGKRGFAKFLFLIGIAMFLFLLYSLGTEGINGIVRSISQANPLLFGTAFLFIIPEIFFKGLKQKTLLKAFGKNISLKESSEVWLAGYLLAAISPGRSGDFLRAVYFEKNFSVKLGNGLSCVLVDRLMDVGLLLLLGVLGLISFSLFYSLDNNIILLLIGLLVLFAICLAMITKKSLVRLIGKPFFRILVPKRFKQKLSQSFHEFYEGFAKYRAHKKEMLFALILTLLAWVFFFTQAFLFALSLGINLPIEFFFWIMPIVTLVETLPISFSGMGTRDWTLAGFFDFAGITAELAVSLSLMILSMQLFLAFLGALFIRKIKSTQAFSPKKP